MLIEIEFVARETQDFASHKGEMVWLLGDCFQYDLG